MINGEAYFLFIFASLFSFPSLFFRFCISFGLFVFCCISVSQLPLLQAFLLMQTTSEEDEKEAQVEIDSQEVSAEAIALVRGLIEADKIDENVRATQISVDEIEVDVSDDDDRGISKTIPASLLEEGNMEKLVQALDPPSPFAIYTSPESKKGSVYVEEAIVHYENGSGQRDQRPGEKTKDDTDYETADELGHELQIQEQCRAHDKQGYGQHQREKDHSHLQKEHKDHESEVRISSANDTECMESRKTKTPVKSLIQKYNSIMKPSEDQNAKKVNLPRQGNTAKASAGGNRKYKHGQGKDEVKERASSQKKVKAEKNMSKVSLIHKIIFGKASTQYLTVSVEQIPAHHKKGKECSSVRGRETR